jgi:hypothetical protein
MKISYVLPQHSQIQPHLLQPSIESQKPIPYGKKTVTLRNRRAHEQDTIRCENQRMMRRLLNIINAKSFFA